VLSAEKLGDDSTAYELGRRAREALPADCRAGAALGKVYYRRGDFSYAVQLLKEGARQYAGDADLIYHLGLAQFQLKARAEASKPCPVPRP